MLVKTLSRCHPQALRGRYTLQVISNHSAQNLARCAVSEKNPEVCVYSPYTALKSSLSCTTKKNTCSTVLHICHEEKAHMLRTMCV